MNEPLTTLELVGIGVYYTIAVIGITIVLIQFNREHRETEQ